MNPLKVVGIILVGALLCPSGVIAQKDTIQNSRPHKLFIPLNQAESRWIAFHTYVQLWARYNQNNPGSTVFGEPEDFTTDLSVRRFRLGLRGQLTERLFTYLQIGVNNLNYLSSRGTSVDLLDAYAEYKFANQVTLGGGKTAWTGLSRYSAPNTSRLLTHDIHFLPMPTVNQLNDLLRKFSIYLKGQIGQLDYRLVGSKPFSAQESDDFDPLPEEGVSKFTDNPSAAQFSTYFKWQFWERESNQIPFSDGTYHGRKRILNLGAGLEIQSDALWHLQNGDTITDDMRLWAVDLFLDLPFNDGRTALTFYSAFFEYDLGPRFIRNVGANNPANGVDPNLASFNGAGNAYPAIGSGSSIMGQVGYLFPPFSDSRKLGRLQPYAALQHSDFERLTDPMIAYDLGINWLLNSHLSKFSLNFQSRPIFLETSTGIEAGDRKWMVVLQYIVRID